MEVLSVHGRRDGSGGAQRRQMAGARRPSGAADAAAFGTPFLANPDLATRLRLDAPLDEPAPTAFYGGDVHG